MKISGGEFNGRSIKTLSGHETRPTGSRARETLFNILAHRYDHQFSVVLDCFSGSGTIGLECLSRGADRVIAFEKNSSAIKVIRSNYESLSQSSKLSLLTEHRVHRWAELIRKTLSSGEKIDFVYCDPPFESRFFNSTLTMLDKAPQFFADNALMVGECSIKSKELSLDHWRLTDTRDIGESRFYFYQFS